MNRGGEGSICVKSESGIALRGVSKAYGATHAVNDMALNIAPGQILGVVGPNGAGKSTLMRIIAGETIPDSGSLIVEGQEVDFQHYSPQAAHALGIRFVHQELALCSNLTVFENFLVEFGTAIDRPWRRAAISMAKRALESTFPNSGIAPTDPVHTLSLAQQQMVEIARAVSAPHLRLLIFDEPTSALPHQRVEQFRVLLQRLREMRCSVVLITHRLDEALSFTDFLVVMREGSMAWSGAPTGLSKDDLVVLMGGRPSGVAASAVTEAQRRAEGKTVLAVDGLTHGVLRNVHLYVHTGEIVGIAGLEGSGQRELLRTVYERNDPAICKSGELAFVSGDRRTEGLFPLWSVARNMSLSVLREMAHWTVVDQRAERSFVAHWINWLQLKAAGPDAPITSLSGGNQQKTIIARALATQASLIVLDDPTRGVDAQTKQQIYKLLHSATAQGRGILWYSTEDQELLECDRVYVMARGAVVDELKRGEISEENLVTLAFKGQETQWAREAEEKGRLSLIQRVLGWVGQRWMLPFASLTAMVILLSSLNSDFLSTFGLGLVVGSALPLVLAALSQMFIILLGDIDLGIGSFLGLVNVITVTWLVSTPGLATVALLGFTMLYPLVGTLIYLRQVPAIVVTLGTSFVWLGVALTIQPTVGGVSPDWLTRLYGISVPVVSEPVLLTIVAGLLAYWFVMRTRFGTLLRSYGNNPGAVMAAGWSVVRLRVLAYLLSGAFALLAGLAFTAVTASGDATAANSYTLFSIASVILGGSEFIGGIVVPLGVVAGALTLSFVDSLLSFLSISPDFTSAVKGLILLLVLVARGLGQWLR